MNDEHLLNVTEFAAKVGASKRAIWLWKDAGKIPAPLHLGRLVRWRASDVEKWIADGCPSCRTPLPPRGRTGR
jgi:excisionase family DNA binding protein